MMRFLKGYIQKAEDGTLAVAIATDGSIDRDGERIDPNGWDLTNFIKNPVLLWAHDYRTEPVGKVEEITRDGGRILFKPKFAIDISEFAKRIFAYYEKGILSAFSVGFIPREWKDERGADGEVVRTFTKTELLEISCVPVPSNPNALVMARSMGIDTEAMKKDFKDGGTELTDEPPVKTEEAERAAFKMEILTSVDEKVAAATGVLTEKISAIAAAVDELQKSISGDGKGGSGGETPEKAKVDGAKGVDAERLKLALQGVNKQISGALHLMKRL